MTTEQPDSAELLKERVEYLEDANRHKAFVLELAADMVYFHGNISQTSGSIAILEEAQKFLNKFLLDFKVMAFFLVDEEDASFNLELCNPEDKHDEIQELGDQLIDSGEFAWALNQHRGLITRSKFLGHSVFLHQLATDNHIRGMFVGVLDLGGEGLASSFAELFSIVFRNTAYAIESAELYQLLDDHNKHLELRVEERTQELNSANHELERANKFIRNTFGRYMSDEVVDSILDTPEGLRLGGERREVTVMITDLRGFTAISEELGSEEVVTILNMYLEVMTDIVLKYHGIIIEFLGDGILVLFGAPVTRDDDPQRAVACALEMQKAMVGVNANNWDMGYPELKMGIGVNSGQVVAGNLGSEKRSTYSVIGSTVNLVARIESFSVGGQILISESTKSACGSLLRIDDVLKIKPKGITKPIDIYHVGAIAAPYDIALPEPVEPDYIEVPSGLTVDFVVLKGKTSGVMDLSGQITGLADGFAKITTTAKLKRFANLKLALFRDGDKVTQDLYAKVTVVIEGENPEIHVTFTATPAKAAKLFKEFFNS
jgi:adenylate cyclase